MTVVTIRPLPKQHLAWEKLKDWTTKYILFGGGAGGGKSWLGAEWLLSMCYFYPGTRWYIGRKELKRLMQSSYITFTKVCSYHNIPRDDWKLNGQYNYIEFKNGSRIDLLDLNYQPADPDFERFGSLEYTGGWIDEAGEVVFKAFDVLKTRVGRHLNKEYNIPPKTFLTANPNRGWLKRLFWKPYKEGTLPNSYAFIQSLYSDNSYTAATYGESLNEISDDITRQRLRDGNWDYDDPDGALVSGTALSDIWTNTVDENDKYATIDVARFGKDTTKVYLWKGFRCYKRITWQGQDTLTTSRRIKEILREEGIPYSHVIIDEVGVGGGVLDNLSGCNGFIANASPLEDLMAPPVLKVVNGAIKNIYPKENYKTLKDQCGYKLADKINAHKIAIDTESESEKEYIEQEIEELKDAKPDSDGKKQLVPKDKIKESIGRSPDDLDCLIMRMWFELSEDGEPTQFELQRAMQQQEIAQENNLRNYAE